MADSVFPFDFWPKHDDALPQGPAGIVVFDTEDIEFKLNDENQTADWLRSIAHQNDLKVNSLTYVFCTDKYLHEMNIEYLQHDTLTDIITFDDSNLDEGWITGEMYISIERVKDNATDLKITFEQELNRVLVHGLLHLCGFGDKTIDQVIEMRRLEDAALQLLNNR
jgi:probable rRNA maturation factor